MGKKTVKGVVERVGRYIALAVIIILLVYPIFLPFLPFIRDGQATWVKPLAIFGGVAAGLLGLVWIVRRKSWRFERLTNKVVESTAVMFGDHALAVLSGIVCLGLGIYYAFDPQDQLTSVWWQIRDQQFFDAASFAAVPEDTLLAVGGSWEANQPLSPLGFIAFVRDELSVYPCDPNDNEDCLLVPGGGSEFWVEISQAVPDLTLAMPGGTVTIHAAPGVIFGGLLHEMVVDQGNLEHIAFTVEYNGQILMHGALRGRGFRDGDEVMVVGRKTDDGGLVPSHLIGGGREQLKAYFRSLTGYQVFLRVAGVVMMISSPFVVWFLWDGWD